MTNKTGGLPSLSDNVNVKTQTTSNGAVETDNETTSTEPKMAVSQKQLKKQWESNETFFMTFNEEKKVGFEVDLISQREKGKEERFLKIEVQGYDRVSDGQLGRVFILIDQKDSFDAFKEFISKLNWNS